MTARQNQAALRALRPGDLTDYLLATGWSVLEAEPSEPVTAYEFENERGYFELIVPKHPTGPTTRDEFETRWRR